MFVLDRVIAVLCFIASWCLGVSGAAGEAGQQDLLCVQCSAGTGSYE